MTNLMNRIGELNCVGVLKKVGVPNLVFWDTHSFSKLQFNFMTNLMKRIGELNCVGVLKKVGVPNLVDVQL